MSETTVNFGRAVRNSSACGSLGDLQIAADPLPLDVVSLLQPGRYCRAAAAVIKVTADS